MPSSKCMTWDGTAIEQLLLNILATHDIKVDYSAVAASFGPHCTPKAVQEKIKKLKAKAKSDAGITPDAETDGGPGAMKTVKAKADAGAAKGVKPVSKKRKTNGGGGGLLSPPSEEGQKSDEGVVPDGELDGASTNGNGPVKRILAAKRKAEEMVGTEDGDGDRVAVKAEGGYQHEDDLSDISAFDPADDQLTAEYERSLEAI